MANKSNKELIAEAQGLARELGTSVDTEGLKNDALVALVEDLRARRAAEPKGDAAQAEADAKAQAEADAKAQAEADAKAQAEADAKAQAEADAKAAPATKEPVYKIGKPPKGMRSVTSLRGMLVSGTLVSARDFHGGEETFRDLLARGVVVTS
jgi:hypothetical protein